MFTDSGEISYDRPVENEFEALLEVHRGPAYRLALLLCSGDVALAEDAVSQAFADVLPRWRAGGIDDFGAYLRDDVASNPPAGDEPLANAPATRGRLFRVPRIIE